MCVCEGRCMCIKEGVCVCVCEGGVCVCVCEGGVCRKRLERHVVRQNVMSSCLRVVKCRCDLYFFLCAFSVFQDVYRDIILLLNLK